MSRVIICNYCINVAICYIPDEFFNDTDKEIAYCIECGGCKIMGCNTELNKRTSWDIVADGVTNSYVYDVCDYHAQPSFIPNDATNLIIKNFIDTNEPV